MVGYLTGVHISSRLVTPIRAACVVRSRASYSASLFVAVNSKRSAYVNSIPSGLVRIRPAPDPSTHDDPSVNKIHGLGVYFGLRLWEEDNIGSGFSMRKNPPISVLSLRCVVYKRCYAPPARRSTFAIAPTHQIVYGVVRSPYLFSSTALSAHASQIGTHNQAPPLSGCRLAWEGLLYAVELRDNASSCFCSQRTVSLLRTLLSCVLKRG
ncbi:hypothetical protein Tco_0679178 [Tanacetum coccineum]|uniref:Uncharacterized protein n=1 Tax=Tanacetum coccineum TaxID=301880 RepID=A0ABQ4XH42_9ASTR